jgi:hypothetical protein
MFEQSQIAEFKEAFGLLERGDGFIDKEDLRDMLNSLGLIIFWQKVKIPQTIIWKIWFPKRPEASILQCSWRFLLRKWLELTPSTRFYKLFIASIREGLDSSMAMSFVKQWLPWETDLLTKKYWLYF